MATQQTNDWLQLDNVPTSGNMHFPNIAKIDSNTFILVSQGKICEYNTAQNIWTHIPLESEILQVEDPTSIAYDVNTRKLFMTTAKEMHVFDMTRNELSEKAMAYNLFQSSLCVNSECHLIGWVDPDGFCHCQ